MSWLNRTPKSPRAFDPNAALVRAQASQARNRNQAVQTFGDLAMDRFTDRHRQAWTIDPSTQTFDIQLIGSHAPFDWNRQHYSAADIPIYDHPSDAEHELSVRLWSDRNKHRTARMDHIAPFYEDRGFQDAVVASITDRVKRHPLFKSFTDKGYTGRIIRPRDSTEALRLVFRAPNVG